jgi:hypothetical protein
MLTPEAAARRAGTDTRTIYRRIEAEEVHYRESEGGGLLVCARSLGSGESEKGEGRLTRRINHDDNE